MMRQHTVWERRWEDLVPPIGEVVDEPALWRRYPWLGAVDCLAPLTPDPGSLWDITLVTDRGQVVIEHGARMSTVALFLPRSEPCASRQSTYTVHVWSWERGIAEMTLDEAGLRAAYPPLARVLYGRVLCELTVTRPQWSLAIWRGCPCQAVGQGPSEWCRLEWPVEV